MGKADKVLQAAPIARMLKQADNLKFSVVNRNGFFIVINDVPLLEFDTAQEADKVMTALNTAFESVLTTFRSDYEKKIGDIIA